VKSRNLGCGDDCLEAYGEVPPGKRPLIRRRRRWKNNIKMDLSEVGCEDGRLRELAQNCFQRRVLVLAVLNVLSPVARELIGSLLN